LTRQDPAGFSDPAGRPTRFEGMEASLDRVDDVVRSLLAPSDPGA
jgi:hypothetical protein